MYFKRLLLVVIVISLPVMAVCQKKKWRPIDRAALVAHLANPGSQLGRDERKGLTYSFYWEDSCFNNLLRLKEKEARVFHITYRYVMKENPQLFDTLWMNNFNLNGEFIKAYNAYRSKLTKLKEQSTLQKFGEIAGLLVYPCIIMDGFFGTDKALIYKLDITKCPRTRIEIDREQYSLSLAFITKDYIVAATNKYKGVYVGYVKGDETIAYAYYRFDDASTFGNMYENPLYRERNQ